MSPSQETNPKSFEALITAYRNSPEYCDLADSTRRDYERYLEMIRATWGPFEVAGLLPAHVLALRDKHRDDAGRSECADSHPVHTDIVVGSARLQD